MVSESQNQVDFRVEYLYDKKMRKIGWKEYFEEIPCDLSLFCFDKDGSVFGEDR